MRPVSASWVICDPSSRLTTLVAGRASPAAARRTASDAKRGTIKDETR